MGFNSVVSYLIVYAEMVSNVTAVVHGNGIPFPLDNPDACIKSGLSCPLMKNKTHKYSMSLPILVYYPPVSVSTKSIFRSKKTQTFLFQD